MTAFVVLLGLLVSAAIGVPVARCVLPFVNAAIAWSGSRRTSRAVAQALSRQRGAVLRHTSRQPARSLAS